MKVFRRLLRYRVKSVKNIPSEITPPSPPLDATGFNGTAIPDQGAVFVFHDFERSKIQNVRRLIAQHPLQMSAIYLAVIVFWTTMMTLGAVRLGVNPVIQNLTPHVALFAAILGVFFYPTRLLWVPVLAFVPVFFYPFFDPSDLAFANNPAMSVQLALILFLLNFGAAMIIGGVMRLAFYQFSIRLSPYETDLYTTRVAFAAFGMVCAIQAIITLDLLDGLSFSARAYLGVSNGLPELVTNRIIRGCVVLTAFLLAVIEVPNRRQIGIGIIAATVFPLLAIMESYGLTLFPMVDAGLVAILISLNLPVPSAILACVIGVPLYSGLTGQYLNEVIPNDPHEVTLQRVSIILLVLIVVITAFRSRHENKFHSLDASTRRLNRIRGYAGVGLFSTNLNTGTYRLDHAAATLLNCPRSGRFQHLLDRFQTDERTRLIEALKNTAAKGATLTVSQTDPENRNRRIEMFIWTELSAGNERVAFGLLVDITNETERNEALEKALSELLLRDEKQRQLFSIISHELRTPASVIALLSEDMEQGLSREQIPQLRHASNQLMAVLGDMRQAVNPEKNLPVIRNPYVPYDLADYIRTAFEPTASDNKIILHLDITANGKIRRIGDQVRNRQILSNLVRNAILHSGGQDVTLSWRLEVTHEGAFSVWKVADNGRGIPEAELHRLFEPFERGKADIRRRADGSGLGLFIARMTARSLGGDLWHEPVPGGGAGFIVRIPEAEAPQETAVEATPAPQRKAPRHLNILIAEDNLTVAAVMQARFKRDFDQVRIAENGQMLLDAYEEQHPDAIVTDLFMPEMDGDEAARILRERGFAGPIIGLTAAAIGEEVDRLSKAGVDLVLYKPVDMAAVHELLCERFPASENPPQ